LAGARRTPDRRGSERRRAGWLALRKGLVRSGVTPPSLALHFGDARDGDRQGRWAGRLGLASGQATHLSVEPVRTFARSGRGAGGEMERMASGLRGSEARVGGVAAPRAPGAMGRGGQ